MHMATEKKKFKAVIFDWGGVCCSGAEPFASSLLQQKLGMSLEEVTDSALTVYLDYCKGKYTKESFWKAVLSHFNLTEDDVLNPDTLSAAYIGSYVLYTDVLALVEELKSSYQLGLLSNLTPEMRDHIRVTHHTPEYFATEVYSCDPGVGVLKPDQEAFGTIMKKMGRKPEECIFIDDSQNNILAAEALGMHTIHFKNKSDALAEINALL